MTVTLRSRLKEALRLDLDYTERRPTGASREAAVLILMAPHAALAVGAGAALSEDASILFTRRTETLQNHKGQIAFPGGTTDPGDFGPIATALRETQEEVGLGEEGVEVIGMLPPLLTVTGFRVTPVLAVVNADPASLPLFPNPAEIAETFWAPLSLLRSGSTYRCELYEYQGKDYPIHVYQVGGHRIWGATGAILKNLLDRLAFIE